MARYTFPNLLVLLLIVCFSATIVAKSPIDSNKEQVYIVQLSEPPLAQYQGGIGKYKATNIKTTGKRKLDVQSSDSLAYKSHLASRQQDILDKASALFKSTLQPIHRYDVVFNGFAVKLNSAQAQAIQSMNGVKSVEPEKISKPHTDRGPGMIGAPDVWSGVFNATQARGEGVVVGIIDTGIHHDHPSFAAVSPADGYVHINPLGANVYLGNCVFQPSLCNDKLIGSYNMVTGNTEVEDEHSHGTHVASTAIGNALDFDLGGGNSFQLSGVAPRANVISYKIADASGTSSGSGTVAAINQAVADGVDVINYSFGSDSVGSPWSDSEAMAYLAAREAGVVVLTSAGNSGPLAETVGSPANAPWLTSVAATTHDRGAFPTKRLNGMTGGSATPPSEITGRSLTGAITAAIVYAGDFSNGDANPEQCLTPFPANTFTGQIVLCDRGEIARVEKAQNVAAGGAGGFILSNVSGGASNLSDDIYVIPGIQIAASDGTNVKNWLASGSNHNATITGTDGSVGVNTSASDRMADFSSRGPNANPGSVLAPSLAAPGVSILAADLAPVDYGFKSGTSMASPHAAGAAALLVQLQPTWSAAKIHSALATSGSVAITKENGVTAADSFDIGGGRIDIPSALNAGLTVSEIGQNFRDANPGNGGDPKSLNLPSMVDAACLTTCSWTRTFEAVEASSWTVSVSQPANGSLVVSQDAFSLTAGQTIDIDFTITTTGGANHQWLFGAVTLTPSSGTLTATRVPVIAKVVNSSLSGHAEVSSQTSSGTHQFANLSSIAQSNVTATAYLAQATEAVLNLAEDSDNSDAYDDLQDGVSYRTVTVSSGSQLLLVRTDNSSANDMDLFVGIDLNGNGQPDENEEIQKSTSPDSDEEIVIDLPSAGTYWILVQNWQGSGTATDSVTLTYGVVSGTANSNVTLTAPSTLDGSSAFAIDMAWSNLNPINTKWVGVAALGNASDADFLGRSSFVISRGATPDSTGGGGGGGSSGGGAMMTIFLLLILHRRRRQ